MLVVDDEAVLRRLLEVNLRAAGFAVRTASSGAGALAAVHEPTPDAIVLDLGLPDGEGWTLLERLRADQRLARVPVVVVSGTDRDAEADRGYPADVEAFLTKPVEPADLVETLRRLTAGA